MLNASCTAKSLARILTPARHADELVRLLADNTITVVDTYADQLAELAEIRDPHALGRKPRPIPSADAGEAYVHYPRRRTVVRILGENAYRELRTNRNRNLLTEAEQQRFTDFPIAFAGLNVGNSGAVCIALEGGSRKMKLADLDPLSLSNLNRFRAGLSDLGLNKATLTAEQILETDPYYDISLYTEGISAQNMRHFLDGVSLLVEEMDALPLKIAIREEARSRKIPVIMVTGSGESIILDIERYDLEPMLPILNGHLPDTVRNEIMECQTSSLAPSDKVRLARDFMGVSHLDERLVESFTEYGTSLVGIPQLAEVTYLRGAALCHVAKAIALNREMPSGRYSFAFGKHMAPTG